MKLDSIEIQILNYIRNFGGVSRKAIAETLRLSQATITKVTKVLMDQHYIVEGDRIGKGMGRKEVQLYLNPQKFRFLGIDIGGYRVRLALSDYCLEMTRYKEYLTAEFDVGPDRMKTLLNMVDLFLTECQLESTGISAIGISVTGIVDLQMKRMMGFPHPVPWGEADIVNRMQTRYNCPVYLDESGRTMALTERISGKAKEMDDFMVVQIGFGVAAGIMINGRLVRGANHAGGLLGHITADEKAGRCSCGNYGCLENLAAYPAMEDAYRRKAGEFQSLAEAYPLKDKIAIDVCIAAGKAIGSAMSNAINLFNPHTIYMGGPVFEQFPLIVEETKRTILIRANRLAALHIQLAPNSFGMKQGIMGALELARDSLIT